MDDCQLNPIFTFQELDKAMGVEEFRTFTEKVLSSVSAEVCKYNIYKHS